MLQSPRHDSNTEPSNINQTNVVAPTGFEPVFQSRSRFRQHIHMVLPRERLRMSTRLKHARARPSVQIEGPQSPISKILSFEVDLI